MRRDRIKDPLKTYVDIDFLSKAPSVRNKAIATLKYEKRKHTQGVLAFYDKNKRLPNSYTDTDFSYPCLKIHIFGPYEELGRGKQV